MSARYPSQTDSSGGVLMKITAFTPEGEPQTAEEVDRERIRQLAYDLYEKRGRVHGSDLDDWLRAESELTKKHEIPF